MIGRALAAVLLLIFPMAGGAADNNAECESAIPERTGCITITRWTTRVDPDALMMYRVPSYGNYTDEVDGDWRTRFTPYCRANVDGPNIIDNVLCQQALLACERLGSDAKVAMYMVLTPLFPGGIPRLEGPICFANSTAIPIGPIIQDLIEQEIGTDPPPIVLQPTDAIVNLPMIASTDRRAPIVIDVTDPIIGTAQATPEFVWTFAEGASAHGPGLPYDGTSPTGNPGYYVAYTYRALGSPTVVLTVTWRVTFTVPGYPPVQLEDVVRIAEQSTQVRAAGSELVGG